MPFNDYDIPPAGTSVSLLSGSPVSTFANNSTISAYRELAPLKKLDSKEYNEKKKLLDANWGKISKAESRLLILDSSLTFSPTFIFGVLIYSLITNPQNWASVGVFLGIFLIFIVIAMRYKTSYQEEVYTLGQAQEDLKQEIKELKQPRQPEQPNDALNNSIQEQPLE